MNKDSQHKSTEAQQWPPISFEKHVWQQDGNQDATERIEEDVVKGESKGPFAKAVEGSGDSGSSSLGLNRSTEMEYQAALPLLIAERSVAVPDDLSARISALLVEMARFDVELGRVRITYRPCILREWKAQQALRSIDSLRPLRALRLQSFIPRHPAMRAWLWQT